MFAQSKSVTDTYSAQDGVLNVKKKHSFHSRDPTFYLH